MHRKEDQRPQIYSYPIAIGEQPVVQSFSLAELMHGIPDTTNEMMQKGNCYVTGIQFAYPGSLLYEQMVEQAVTQIKRLTLNPELENQTMAEVRNRRKLHHTTNFRAYRYPDGDGMIYQGVITNTEELAIIYFSRRLITLVPYIPSHRGLFHDAIGAKLALAHWQYSGTLVDALAEFWQKGYSFNQARHPQNSEERISLIGQPISQAYITTRTGMSLKEVAQIVTPNSLPT